MNNIVNKKSLTITLFVFVILSVVMVHYWSQEPAIFDVSERNKTFLTESRQTQAVGQMTSTVLIEVASTLLNKPGGYISNDKLPPFVFMDNIPAWEFGALEMVRDLALAMRKDFSRSQSQSIENEHLIIAHPKFNIGHHNWLVPSAESEYRQAIEEVALYRLSLGLQQQQRGQFYARADNLRDWLKQTEKRLGSLSQRLSASVGQDAFDTDLAGDSAATQSTPTPSQFQVKTSWWKLDDVFYEARGASWALLHFLTAVEIDFSDVLEKKNAQVSLKQIIRELEASQQTIWSPMILNGDGFGLLANHSLVMANYISRANAALIDLNELLQQG